MSLTFLLSAIAAIFLFEEKLSFDLWFYSIRPNQK